MSEYVIMPKTHWKGICDAVRDGNGTTDLILSGDTAEQIRAISKGCVTAGIIYNEVAGVYPTNVTINGQCVPPYACAYNPFLHTVDLDSAIVTIGQYAFKGCGNISSVVLPDGLTDIKPNAFSLCTNLVISTLPDSMNFIREYAFSSCESITTIELPSDLWNIGEYAFAWCYGLTSVTFKSTQVVIDSTAFDGCTNLTTINVPWAEGEVANAPWGATNATINYNYTKENEE